MYVKCCAVNCIHFLLPYVWHEILWMHCFPKQVCFQFFPKMFSACSKRLERNQGVSSTPSVRIYGNSVRPILFVFDGSQDRHTSLNNAGWFVQGLRCCSHRSTNVTEIGRADAVNKVPSQYGDFVADSVLYGEPVENITEDRGDMAELPLTNVMNVRYSSHSQNSHEGASSNVFRLLGDTNIFSI